VLLGMCIWAEVALLGSDSKFAVFVTSVC